MRSTDRIVEFGPVARIRPVPGQTTNHLGLGFDWVERAFSASTQPPDLGSSKICGFEIEIASRCKHFQSVPGIRILDRGISGKNSNLGYSVRRIFHGIFTYGTTTFFPRCVQFQVVTQHA